MTIEKLILGNTNTKKNLGYIFDNPNIAPIREGIALQSEIVFLFITLDKVNKESAHKYNDFFDIDSGSFEWDSQNKQNFESLLIQQLVTNTYPCLLFSRVHDVIDNKTQPFIFCGPITYRSHHIGTANPVHLVFNVVNIDDNPSDALSNIYAWKPENFLEKKSLFSEAEKSDPIINQPKKNIHKTNVKVNDAIEARSMQVVMHYFRKKLFDVEDVSKKVEYHCDLLCSKDNIIKRVEVKGRKASDGWKAVKLSYREGELAMNQGDYDYDVDLYIVYDINIQAHESGDIIASGGKICHQSRYHPRYPRLRPTGYIYKPERSKLVFDE